MAAFDQGAVFSSGPRDEEERILDENEGVVDQQHSKKKFKEFLRQFQDGTNFEYKYRDILRRNYNTGQFWIEVQMNDVQLFDETLADLLERKPADYIDIFEDAAKEVTDEITAPRPVGQEVEDIHVMLISDSAPVPIRELRSDKVSRLVKITGMILTASGVRSKALKMSLMCRSCRSVIPNISIQPGLEGYAFPRMCNSNTGPQAGQVKCAMDPYFILPDKCKCVDFQLLKMQEVPDCVPPGEMPRHMQLYVDRYLCDKVVPGNRVSIYGIYSIKRATQPMKKTAQNKIAPGVRQPYFRVFGIELDTDGSGRSSKVKFTPQEEEKFQNLSRQPDCYERIARSIAPSIYGSKDIKKSIACLLFGGSRKRLPDGLTRRGDINVLLLGDPGTAKSQLLKFVEKCSPIGIYTSGKGSSAAGLTASVNRDPVTKNFVMEGGAMVLADGGVVCIDEFDKMREDDRVAIHEAMEQQTISIAKAGITTTLNSRCAVLAAANSIFGRWDDTKGDENIDFMPTILSRFDMIYIVKDEHSEAKDMMMARHVMQIHMNAGRINDQQTDGEGELPLEFLKKYICYCRSRCGPRLTAEAAEKLKNRYVLWRSGNREAEIEADHRSPIPITVRQLEAIIRTAESLAKMELKPFASDVHVDEALRLFQVSTLDAASNGQLAGVEGFTTKDDYELISRIESQLKRRLAIGSQVSEHAIINDFIRQKYPERAIRNVLQQLIKRGDLQHRLQRKVVFRVK